jgi:N-glycosylase/DNA lyase
MTESAESLLGCIEKLKRTDVGRLIDARVKEFRKTGEESNSELFKELCFCILTANFNAERSIKIQAAIGDGFLTLSETQLARKLRELGYRFPNSRAKYIAEARRHENQLKHVLESSKDAGEAREWLAKNVKGIGYKEASHFLRNVGCTEVAIIDFHIVNMLARCALIEKPKTLSKRRYFEIEVLLKEIAEKACLNLAELDLYLWYMETGKILK